jgi:hypothetical protein
LYEWNFLRRNVLPLSLFVYKSNVVKNGAF